MFFFFLTRDPTRAVSIFKPPKNLGSFRRVHEERGEGEGDEDDAADEGDGADGDPLSDDAAAQHRQARAHGVAEDAGDHLGRKNKISY